MPHEPYSALYIHMPFCVQRCAYCDFSTAAVPSDSTVIDEYVERIVKDLRSAARSGELSSIETIYIGGGTPSHVGLARLSALLYAIGVSVDIGDDTEFSMEANPESLSVQMLRDVRALGVNRISIGVQSLDDEVLALLGRPHDSAAARRAMAAAREHFDNVSVDVMCGIPGQTDEQLKATVQAAIDCDVAHISVYPLTIEPHTFFDRQVMAGQLDEPDEDDQARHMELCATMLARAGYGRYEVASYARPGRECRHNIAYWTGKPYLGIGQSAATCTQNDARRMRVTDGEVTDDLDARHMLAEDLMLAMRMTAGAPPELVRRARAAFPSFDEVVTELVEAGLVRAHGGRIAPTEKGWLCGNELYGRLLDLGDA